MKFLVFPAKFSYLKYIFSNSLGHHRKRSRSHHENQKQKQRKRSEAAANEPKPNKEVTIGMNDLLKNFIFSPLIFSLFTEHFEFLFSYSQTRKVQIQC